MNQKHRNILVFGISLLMAPLFFSFIQVDTKDWNECLKKSSFKWGGDCKSCTTTSKTYKVWFKNSCEDTLGVKIAVQENHKRWRTFTRTQLLPGDSISGFACIGTGKYLYWAKKCDDNTVAFPSDEEINSSNPF
jgi:hypothetical protein